MTDKFDICKRRHICDIFCRLGRHIVWDQIRIEIHNWDLENSDTFDKCNKFAFKSHEHQCLWTCAIFCRLYVWHVWYVWQIHMLKYLMKLKFLAVQMFCLDCFGRVGSYDQACLSWKWFSFIAVLLKSCKTLVSFLDTSPIFWHLEFFSTCCCCFQFSIFSIHHQHHQHPAITSIQHLLTPSMLIFSIYKPSNTLAGQIFQCPTHHNVNDLILQVFV